MNEHHEGQALDVDRRYFQRWADQMQWEYFRLATVEASLDDALQDLGRDGWELVSVLPEGRLFQGFQCVLKRPWEAGAEPRPAPSVPIRAQKPLMSTHRR